MADAQFLIGNESGDHFRVVVLESQRPLPPEWVVDYPDNPSWLLCRVEVKVGAWRGNPLMPLRSEYFRRFKNETSKLYDTLSGTATFGIATDGLLYVLLTPDPLGHISVDCAVGEEGEVFKFTLKLDQTFFPSVLRDLDMIEQEFENAFRYAG